jgi:hypothetical protein
VRIVLLATIVALTAAPASAADTELVFKGQVPGDGLDHFFIPFEVPRGTLELQIHHDDLSEDNILDWGLDDPAGARGWGGGDPADAIIGALAATRSYRAGPIQPGTWRVVVGKAKIAARPAEYEVTITLRGAPTLAPQPERRPYEPVTLGGGRRWYAGDFHVHSRESGDASPTLDEVALFARARGLDFVVLTEHNTVSHLDLIADAQSRHPELLLIPGIEFTTYAGHANVIGAAAWIDHRIGQPGVTIEAAAAAARAGGALFSINHPELDLGDLCIGCAWKHQLDPAQIDALEIATGGLDKAGKFYTAAAIARWEQLCGQGHKIAAIGGSDDHKAGVELGSFQSPIGDPTTLVLADTLSAAAIIAGVRAGRTAVKLQGPADPSIEFDADIPPVDGTITADQVTLRAIVRGAPAGSRVRFVEDGAPRPDQEVSGDPFELSELAVAPGAGESRWRVELLIEGKVRTITSHLWLSPGTDSGSGSSTAGETTGAADPSTSDPSTSDPSGTSAATAAGSQDTSEAGCGCVADPARAPLRSALALLLPGALIRRRRRRPSAAPGPQAVAR